MIQSSNSFRPERVPVLRAPVLATYTVAFAVAMAIMVGGLGWFILRRNLS